MRAALVIVIVAVGLIGSIRSRYAGLLLYVWFALFRPQEWAYGAIDSLRLSVVIWLALAVPAVLTGVLPNLTHPLSLATIAFVFCALVAQLNAVSPESGWMGIQILVTTISVALFAVTVVKTRNQFLGLLGVVAASIGFHAAKFGVGFLYNGGIRYYDGIGGMFDANNEFALAITRTMFMVIATAQNVDSKWLRRALFAAVLLSVFAVISTFSREGFLSLTAGGLVFIALQRRKAISLVAVGFAAALVILIAPIPDDYFSRLGTIRTFDAIQDESALARIHVWTVAVDIARDYPFGVGVQNFESLYDKYDFLNGRYGRGRAAHNTYLQVLVETGIQGFIVYLFLLTYGCWCCWRLRARSRTPGLAERDQRLMASVANALIASLAAFVVGGTFSSQMMSDLNWFTFALIAAADRVSRSVVLGVGTATIPMETGGGEALLSWGVAERPTGF